MTASSSVGLGAGISGQWGVGEAKARLSEVVQKAMDEGPQEITKSGKDAVVVVSKGEWMKRTKPKQSLAEFLLNSPLRGSAVKIGRVRLDPRHVDF